MTSTRTRTGRPGAFRRSTAALTALAVTALGLAATALAPTALADTMPEPVPATQTLTSVRDSKTGWHLDPYALYLPNDTRLATLQMSPEGEHGIVVGNEVDVARFSGGYLPLTTIAIDGGNRGQREPTLYSWAWNGNGAGGTRVFAYAEGSTTGQIYTVMNPREASGGSVNPLYNYWSGGEVNQNTGEIYFSPGECTGLGGPNATLSIFDPVSREQRTAAHLVNAGDKSIFGSAPSPCSGTAGGIASDMAIDAAGNAYLFVQASGVTDWTSDAATQLYMVRVVPGKDKQDWYYNVVGVFTDASGLPRTDGALVYGAAFLNGKVYAGDARLNRFNPLSMRFEGSTDPRDFFDLASAQMAPVLDGIVYDDANGNGVKDGEEKGLARQTVAIYGADGTLRGTRTTDASGTYSFMLDSTSGDYTVRVVQPVINGVHGWQTGADSHFTAGDGSIDNSAESFPKKTETSEAGASKAGVVDPAAGTIGEKSDLATFPSYTTVHVRTDNEVSSVDMGVTAGQVSFGDAPFQSKKAQNGAQLSGPDGSLRLGATRGASDDGATDNSHATDDGVFVAGANGMAPLTGKNAVLAVGGTYDLIGSLQGAGADRAKLSAWLAQTNKPTSFDNGTASSGLAGSAREAGYAYAAQNDAVLTLTVPSDVPQGGLAQTWLRTVAADKDSKITDPSNAKGQYAPEAGSAQANASPWTSPGEVEDYEVYVAGAVIRVAAQTTGVASGDFGYMFSDNVSTQAPSSRSDMFHPKTAGTVTYSETPHALSTTGKPVTITNGTIPPGWRVESVTVVDTRTGKAVDATVDAGMHVVTIPGTSLPKSADLTVLYRYTADADPRSSTWEVDTFTAPADGTTAITAEATIKNVAGAAMPGATVTFTAPDGVKVSAVQDHGDGTYTATLTSDHVITAAEVTASVEVEGAFVPFGQSQQVSFTAGTPVASASSFEVSPLAVSTDADAGVPVTVTTKDVNGHAVSGAVTLTAPDGALIKAGAQAPAATATVTTSDQGLATVAVVSATPGDFTITATLGGAEVTAGKNHVAHFTVGAPSAATSSFAITPDTTTPLPASGTDAFTGTVTVKDKNGNPIAGARVTLDVPAGLTATIDGTAIGDTPVTTADDGTVVVRYTATKSGTYPVAASVDGLGQVGRTEDLLFFSTATDPKNEGTRWELTGSSVTADGTAAVTATITLKDGGSRAVSGAKDAITVDTNTAVTVSEVTETAVPGTYQATLTSTTAGTFPVQVKVQVGGTPVTITNRATNATSQDAVFTPGPASAQHSVLTVPSGGVPLKTGQSVTVQVNDAHGNAVEAGTPVTITAPAAPDGLTFTSEGCEKSGASCTVPTDAGGTVVVTVTSAVPATYEMSATIDGKAVPAAKDGQRNDLNKATFVSSGQATAAESEWAVTGKKPRDADGDSAYTGTFTARDEGRKPVANQDVTIQVPSEVTVLPQTGTTPLPRHADGSVTVTTGAGGTAVVRFVSTQANTDPGFAVSAWLGGEQVDDEVALTFVATDPDVKHLGTTWELAGSPAVADGTAAVTATIRLVDAHGNPASGPVTVVPSSKDVTAGTPQQVDRQPGVYTVTLTSKVAGTYSASAFVTVNGQDAPIASPLDYVFTHGAVSLDRSHYRVSSGSVAADDHETHVATATVADANGNPVPGAKVTFRVESPAHFAGGSETVAETDAQGVATATITSGLGGTYTVTAAVVEGALTGDPVTASFTSVAADPEKSVWSIATDGTRVANGKDAYEGTFQANDPAGRAVAFTTVSIAVPADVTVKDDRGATLTRDAVTGTVSVVTDRNGAATVSFVSTKAGEYPGVDAMIGAVPVRSDAVLTYVAGALDVRTSEFAVATTDGSATVLADGTASWTATITARDEFRNLVSGVADQLTVQSVGKAPVIGAVIESGTPGTYTARITSGNPGTYSLTAAANEALIGKVQTVEFVTGTPVGAKSDLTVAPATVPADSTTTATITVQLRDAFGNAVTAADGAVRITRLNEVGAVSDTVRNADGTFTATITSSVVDTAVVSFTLDGKDVPEKTASVSFSDAKLPPTPIVDPSNGKTVTGTAGTGLEVVVTNPETGQELCTAPVGNGRFTCDPEVDIPDGTVVLVTAKKDEDNVSRPVAVTIDAKAPSAPKVDPSNGRTVTGTADADSVGVVVKGPDGTTLCEAPTDADGHFTCVPKDRIADDVIVAVIAKDKAKNESKPEYVKVDAAEPLPPVPDPSNGKTVTGSAEPGSMVTVTETGKPDAVLCTAKADASTGRFTCTPGTPIGDGTEVDVLATDAVGNVSRPTPVTVDAVPPVRPTVDPTNGTEVTGTGETSGDTVTVKVGDTQLCVAKVGTNHTWSCVPKPLPRHDTELSVTETDLAGNVSEPATATVDAVAPDAPVVKPSQGDKVTGTAEPGSTVTVSTPGGTKLCSTVATDGNFTCDLEPDVANGTELVATATDKAGNVSGDKEFTTDSEAPAAPHVNPTDGKTVSGTGEEPGDTVTVRSGATEVCTTTVQADGTWTCTTSTALANDATVTATETDPAGNVSLPSESVRVDTVAPGAPGVEPSKGDKVTGRAEEGATVTVSTPDGKELCSVVALGGVFECDLEPAVANGTELVATAKDEAGNVSPEARFSTDSQAPGAPHVDPSNGKTITGTTEEGATVVVKDADGKKLCEVLADSSGNFTCIPKEPVADGVTVSVTATDGAGNASQPTTIVVDADAPDSPTVNPTNGETVSGKGADEGDTVIVKDGATEVCRATVGKDLTWSCTPEPAITGTSIVVSEQDGLGNESKPVTWVLDKDAPGAPEVEPSRGDKVTGTAEAGMTVTVSTPDGKELCTVVATGGAFSCDLKPAVANETKLVATATDEAGNVSPGTEFSTDSEAPAAPYVEPSNGKTITGTAEPLSTVVVKDADGVPLAKQVVGEDGTWSVTPNRALLPDEEVAATATDPAGNTSDKTPVVLDLVVAAPVVKPSNGTTVTGTAEPGSTVTVTDPDDHDAVLCTAKADAGTGAFTCTPDAQIGDGKTVNVGATDAVGNVSDDTPVKVDAVAPGAPEVEPSKGDKVTGRADAGSTVTVSTPDGKELCTVVATGGAFSCDLKPAVANGTELVATAKDEAGNVSPEARFSTDSQAPGAPHVDPSNGKTITGTTEEGATVVVKDADGKKLCEVLADSSGNFTCIPKEPVADGVTVSVTATDGAGNASLPTTIVVDADAPDAPTVNPSNGETVSGKGTDVGDTVVVTDAAGTPLCQATVGKDLTWSCTPDPVPGHGQTITARETDSTGNPSGLVTRVIDAVPPVPPTVDPTDGKTVSGTGEVQGDTITVTSGDTVVCTTTVRDDLSWTCAPSTVPADGTELKVTETDLAGNVSEPATAVTDGVAPGRPTVDPSAGEVVSGEAEKGSRITVTDPKNDDAVLCSTEADKDSGRFTCPLVPPLNHGVTVEVTATDAAGHESRPTSRTVDTKAPDAPALAPVTGGEVSGSAEPGSSVTVTVTDEEGNVSPLCTVVADKVTGQFTCPLPDALDEGTVVTAVATDPAGNESLPATITVDTTAPGLKTVDPSNGDVVSGEADPGSTVTVTTTSGKELCRVVVPESGDFTCDLDPNVPDGTTLKVTATDGAGNASGAVEVVTDGTAPDAPVVTVADDGTITGQAEAGSHVVVKDADGNTIGKADVGEDGTWSVVLDEPLEPGEVVTATATDAVGNVSDPGFGQVPGGSDTAAARLTVSARVTRTEGGETVTIGHADKAGDLVTYVYTVHNTGGVTLGDPRIVDALAGLSDIDCPDETVAPGQTLSCTASYSVTWHDVDAGLVINTATATLATAAGDRVDAGESTVVVPTGDAFELLGHDRTSDLTKRGTGTPDGDDDGTGHTGTTTDGKGTGGTADGVRGGTPTTSTTPANPALTSGTGAADGSQAADKSGRSGQDAVRTTHGPSFGTGGTAVGGGSAPSPAPAGNGPAVLVAVLTRSPRGLRRWQVR